MTTKTPEIKKVRKTLKGVVSSDKMKDTVTVVVTRYSKHPKYKKFVKTHKKLMAHDASNTKKIGDVVVVEECRPMSRHKRFVVIA